MWSLHRVYSIQNVQYQIYRSLSLIDVQQKDFISQCVYTSNCKTIATRCHHRDASSLFYPCQSQSLQFSCVITYCSSIKGCYLAVYSLKYNSTEGNPILGKQVFNYYCLTGQELIFAFFSPLYTIVPQNSFLYLGYTDCFCRLGIKILKWLLEKVHSSSSNILFKCSHPYLLSVL